VQIQPKQRSVLGELLPQRHAEVRTMTTPQVTLLLAIYHLEEMRTLRYRPSVLLQYFANQSVNESVLIGSLDAIAKKVN
jgi:phosphatidylinositol 4-kinase